jgi:large subunit ribosomal protein L31
MKKDIHPKIYDVTARCACGNSFQTVSTDQRIEVDICSGCHPLFTGQQKFVDTAGRIEKFQARYEKSAAAAKKAATPAKKKK